VTVCAGVSVCATPVQLLFVCVWVHLGVQVHVHTMCVYIHIYDEHTYSNTYTDIQQISMCVNKCA